MPDRPDTPFMKLLAIDRLVPAPASEVYAVLSAVDLLPAWASSVEAVELVDPPPIRVGTRFRETRRHNARPTTAEMRIVELVSDRVVEFACQQGSVTTFSRWTIEPYEDGCVIRFDMRTAGGGAFMRLAIGGLSLLMRGVMRRCLEDDFDDLTRFLAGDGEEADATSDAESAD